MKNECDFKPVNRYLWIELPTPAQNITESGIMLPADFKPEQPRYIEAKIIRWADDVRFQEQLDNQSTAVVDASMVEEINVKNQTINVVQDNYIIGIL